MKLLTKDVAAMVGLKEATIRRYRIRGNFPEPDGTDFGHPWWKEETVTAWVESRRLTQPGEVLRTKSGRILTDADIWEMAEEDSCES